MAKSLLVQLYEINKWAYQYYSKKEPIVPDKKVAWISSFVPVEILESLNFAYIYPESYAAVIAASGKEQECLEVAQTNDLSLDCCSYSACFNGCLSLNKGPRGIPPLPNVLIASSNQCNTLPNWWNLLATQLGVPLIILDYPGETDADAQTAEYVETQHKQLISQLEDISGVKLNEEVLAKNIVISSENVALWKSIVELLSSPDHLIPVGMLFDFISPLIIARCLPATTEFFQLFKEELIENYLDIEQEQKNKKRIYWAGYPFWYHSDRCIQVDGAHIVGANYITWWNLDYSGKTVWEKLYHAYNFTVLNLKKETRTNLILDDICQKKAEGVVINQNKSCKRDFSSLRESDCPVPYATIESDMIDRKFLDINAAKERLNLLISML